VADNPALADLRLRHLDPSKLLFEHLDASDPDWRPSWFAGISAGGLNLTGWINGTVKVTIEAGYVRDRCAVAVAITGFYATDEQLAMEVPSGDTVEADGSMIAGAAESERREFSALAMRDLYPYLRAELQMLSSRMSGYPGIALQPEPQLNAEMEANSA